MRRKPMKFLSEQDTHLFLLEIGRIDLLKQDMKKFVPSDESMGLFIKKRKSLIPKLKDFRKRQMTKEQWRKKRYEMMRGIKIFHRSTEGKRFHRNLGNFLATRDFSNGTFIRKRNESVYFEDVSEILKTITSAKTHAFIELEFFHQLNDEVDYQIFMDEVLVVLTRVESGLTSMNGEINKDDLDFLANLTENKSLIYEFAEIFEFDTSFIDHQFRACIKDKNLEESGVLIDAINELKIKLKDKKKKDKDTVVEDKQPTQNVDVDKLVKDKLKEDQKIIKDYQKNISNEATSDSKFTNKIKVIQ